MTLFVASRPISVQSIKLVKRLANHVICEVFQFQFDQIGDTFFYRITQESLEKRLKSAETRADEAEKEKGQLEVESGELRERAATLDSELNKVKAETSIKITEYKRSASQGQDTSNEIYMRQLQEKETELETIQVKRFTYVPINEYT